jgi:hypothetical protein
MIAFVSSGRVSDSIDVQKPALAAAGQESAPCIDDAGGELRVARSLALVFHRIGRILERRRHAEIARRNGPLSLDDAWAGGWYARSQILQEALLQRVCSTSAKPAPRRLDWDDRLD